jgi:hypothetical protein
MKTVVKESSIYMWNFVKILLLIKEKSLNRIYKGIINKKAVAYQK